jgi:4-hydroxybenzoyl-CoA thioesterase
VREFVSEITVEWAHCDAAGIVFFPNFYVWFDQGTERLFTANGLSYAELERDFGIHGMPLLENGTTYRNACRLGVKLRLTTRLEEWAGKTFRMSHRIVHADGTEALEGFERRIFVVRAPESPRGMKAIDAPEAIRARFGD